MKGDMRFTWKLCGFRFKWSLGRKVLRVGGEIEPSLPHHAAGVRVTARLTSVISTPKMEGKYIQTHPAQDPKLLSVSMECCLAVARVHQSQAQYSLSHSSCTPDKC